MSKSVSKEQLEAIERRLQAATPGKWRCETPGFVTVESEPGATRYAIASHMLTMGDATFIARAPTDIAAMLNEIRRLQEVVIGFDAHSCSENCCGVRDDR